MYKSDKTESTTMQKQKSLTNIFLIFLLISNCVLFITLEILIFFMVFCCSNFDITKLIQYGLTLLAIVLVMMMNLIASLCLFKNRKVDPYMLGTLQSINE